MTRGQRCMMFIAALIMPLASLFAQYTHNAEYLSFTHICITGVLCMAVSAIGYGILWLLFRSSFSSLMGCVIAWIAFFLFAKVGDPLEEMFNSFIFPTLGYFGLTLAAALAAAYFLRNVQVGFMGPLALAMACVMLTANLIPAVQTVKSVRAASEAVQYKELYQVDDSLDSPNVYWLHVDGMLGFEAMEQYFGDEQAEFAQSLEARGFEVNRGAYLESGHKTALAVAAMMSPYFFDTSLNEYLSTNEKAVAARDDMALLCGSVETARTFNETRIAFEKKGYTTQTIAFFGNQFPPVGDRYYEVLDPEGAYRLDLGEHAAETFTTIVGICELASLLTTLPKHVFSTSIINLDNLGIEGLQLKRYPLEHPLEAEHERALLLKSPDAKRHAPLMNALNDSLYTPGPTLNIVYFRGAHFPFIYDESGHYTNGDPEDLYNYPAQHRFSAKLLLNMIDMILESDPNAVIIAQSDHGLNGQTREQIASKLGEEAVLPLWNQVLSAIRVPEQYQNGEERYAAEEPLNMARYLVNSFVGKNYEYVNFQP